jgi:hypothetical protein
MSQAEIGNLLVRLGVDTASFTNGMRQAQSSLSTMTGALKGFATAFASSMIVDSVVTAMKAVAEIGDVAETIGVSAEQLQAFNKMAVASGASTDVLTRGLQSIAEQSVDAGSKLGKLFEANNLVMKGKDTNQVIREFMDLVKNAASPTEQLAIITGVLGDKVGRQLVEAFREGAAGADEATKQMVASGEFHSNAEVERLQKLETEYNKIMDRIATGWQQMVVGMLTAAQRVQEEWSSGKPSAASELWNWMTGQPVQDWDINTGQLIGVNTLGQGGPGPFNYPPGAARRTGPATVLPRSASSGSGPGSSSSSSKLVKEDIIPPGTIEDIYGAGEAVHSLAENFQEAQWGAGAFSDALMRVGSTISQGISDGLYGLITGTMTVKEAFASMAQSIIQSLADIAAELAASAALRMILGSLGGGGGAGLNIGGMVFGGLFANGGYLGSGKWGIAGEAGPEIIHGPARITPMDKAGGAANVIVNVTNNTPAQVSTSRRADGSIDIMIEEIANQLARGGGKVDAALQRGYGLRRAGR